MNLTKIYEIFDMPRPTKSDMVNALLDIGVQVPTTAAIPNIRSLYDQHVNPSARTPSNSGSDDENDTDAEDGTNQAGVIAAAAAVATAAANRSNGNSENPPAGPNEQNAHVLADEFGTAADVQQELTRLRNIREIMLLRREIAAAPAPIAATPMNRLRFVDSTNVSDAHQHNRNELSQPSANADTSASYARPISAVDVGAIGAMVSKFTGDDAYDVRKWLSDLEDAFDILNFDERLRFVACRRMLDGTARLFLRTISAHQYDELKQKLLVEFGRTYTLGEVYDRLRQRRLLNTETVQRYVIEMCEIASNAAVPVVELVDFIIDGLGEPSANTAAFIGVTSIAQLKGLVSRYERKRPRFRSTVRPTVAKPNNLLGTVANSANLRTPTAAASSSATAVVSTAAPAGPDAIRCFNCSRFGHFQSACPMPKRPDGSCFKCGQMDHVYKNCPKRVIGQTRTAAAINTSQLDDDEDDVYASELELDRMTFSWLH